MNKNIVFYGATWCPDCRRARAFLDELECKYEYIDIEKVAGAADKVVEINKGYQSIPTIVFPDGKILVEPSNLQLQQEIESLKNQNLLICHKQEEVKDSRVIFVYNADSSYTSQLKDTIYKIVSPKTYQCNLCSLTYGAVSMKDGWKKFIKSLPFKFEFLHKDEFLKQYPPYQNTAFPAAFISKNNTLVPLIKAEEINQQKNLESLQMLLKAKLRS